MKDWNEKWEAAIEPLKRFHEESGTPMILAAVNPENIESCVVTVGTRNGIREALWQIQRTVVKRLDPKEDQ